MNKNKQFVITINRELGSGGRTVGRKLAEKLGVPFYDKAPNHVFEQKFHLSVDEIEKLKGRSHIWWTDFKRIVGIGEALNDAKYYVTNVGDEPELLATEEIFKVETEILILICIVFPPKAGKQYKKKPFWISGNAEPGESCIWSELLWNGVD